MPSHTVTEQWMGTQVETLEDLLRPKLRAVCVGINPSLKSVDLGHYYQGPAGQKFFARLRRVGAIPDADGGFEDDAAFTAGIGFTDIVKRPTANAAELQPAEFRYGRERLVAKLEACRPALVLFTYKKTAEVVFGRFSGNGPMPGLELAGAKVFIMPGPYEAARTRDATLDKLARCFHENGR